MSATESTDSSSYQCRYCWSEGFEPLLTPCKCAGTSKYIHQSCFLQENNSIESCPICQAEISYELKYCEESLQIYPILGVAGELQTVLQTPIKYLTSCLGFLKFYSLAVTARYLIRIPAWLLFKNGNGLPELERYWSLQNFFEGVTGLVLYMIVYKCITILPEALRLIDHTDLLPVEYRHFYKTHIYDPLNAGNPMDSISLIQAFKKTYPSTKFSDEFLGCLTVKDLQNLQFVVKVSKLEKLDDINTYLMMVDFDLNQKDDNKLIKQELSLFLDKYSQDLQKGRYADLSLTLRNKDILSSFDSFSQVEDMGTTLVYLFKRNKQEFFNFIQNSSSIYSGSVIFQLFGFFGEKNISFLFLMGLKTFSVILQGIGILGFLTILGRFCEISIFQLFTAEPLLKYSITRKFIQFIVPFLLYELYVSYKIYQRNGYTFSLNPKYTITLRWPFKFLCLLSFTILFPILNGFMVGSIVNQVMPVDKLVSQNLHWAWILGASVSCLATCLANMIYGLVYPGSLTFIYFPFQRGFIQTFEFLTNDFRVVGKMLLSALTLNISIAMIFWPLFSSSFIRFVTLQIVDISELQLPDFTMIFSSYINTLKFFVLLSILGGISSILFEHIFPLLFLCTTKVLGLWYLLDIDLPKVSIQVLTVTAADGDYDIPVRTKESGQSYTQGRYYMEDLYYPNKPAVRVTNVRPAPETIELTEFPNLFGFYIPKWFCLRMALVIIVFSLFVLFSFIILVSHLGSFNTIFLGSSSLTDQVYYFAKSFLGFCIFQSFYKYLVELSEFFFGSFPVRYLPLNVPAENLGYRSIVAKFFAPISQISLPILISMGLSQRYEFKYGPIEISSNFTIEFRMIEFFEGLIFYIIAGVILLEFKYQLVFSKYLVPQGLPVYSTGLNRLFKSLVESFNSIKVDLFVIKAFLILINVRIHLDWLLWTNIIGIQVIIALPTLIRMLIICGCEMWAKAKDLYKEKNYLLGRKLLNYESEQTSHV